jgi:hypothetical protein
MLIPNPADEGQPTAVERLQAENAELRRRLEEAEETIHADLLNQRRLPGAELAHFHEKLAPVALNLAQLDLQLTQVHLRAEQAGEKLGYHHLLQLRFGL